MTARSRSFRRQTGVRQPLPDADPTIRCGLEPSRAGQRDRRRCRRYVHDSQYDKICEELGRLARESVVDDGLKQGTQMGPLQNKVQFEKAKAFLEDAKRNGKIVAGGEVLSRKGYFIRPTIVRDISDDTRLVTEEQFSP